MGSTVSSPTSDLPSEVVKPFLNSAVTDTTRSASSSDHLPVSRIEARMSSCLCRMCSSSSALKRAVSSIGTSS